MGVFKQQPVPRKTLCLSILHMARAYFDARVINQGYYGIDGHAMARKLLQEYRALYNAAPASTKRRWRCGR